MILELDGEVETVPPVAVGPMRSPTVLPWWVPTSVSSGATGPVYVASTSDSHPVIESKSHTYVLFKHDVTNEDRTTQNRGPSWRKGDRLEVHICIRGRIGSRDG